MGREIRRVPPDWQHPKNEKGDYIPMHDFSYREQAEEWRENEAAWNRGEFPDYADAEAQKLTYTDWAGEHPDERDYMPDWPDEQRTHYQMYEDTSEGTPISPVFASPEEVARWCADNGASAFGGQTASYEHWLRVARGGFAPSAVMVIRPDGSGSLMSGVEAFGSEDKTL